MSKGKVKRGTNDFSKGGQAECWECGEPLEDGQTVRYDEAGHAFCSLSCANGYLEEMERLTAEKESAIKKGAQ